MFILFNLHESMRANSYPVKYMLFDLGLGVWTHFLQKGLKNKDEFIL